MLHCSKHLIWHSIEASAAIERMNRVSMMRYLLSAPQVVVGDGEKRLLLVHLVFEAGYVVHPTAFEKAW